ncbi:hypothetical protein NN561_006415 [Cricetulus griseus]
MDGKLFQEVSSWRSVPADTHTGLQGVARVWGHPQAARSPALPASAPPPASSRANSGTQVPPVPAARRLPHRSPPPGARTCPQGARGAARSAQRPPALRANPVARREGPLPLPPRNHPLPQAWYWFPLREGSRVYHTHPPSASVALLPGRVEGIILFLACPSL